MKSLFKLDWVLLASTLLIGIMGLIVIYGSELGSIGGEMVQFKRQCLSLVLGLGFFAFFSFLDYRTLGTMSTRLYFLIIILLATVFFMGTTVRGTTGWIGWGGFRIQPVEIAKVILIIFMARFLAKKKNELSSTSRVLASLILVGVPVALVLKQPDFGSAAVILAVWLAMVIISGINRQGVLVIVIAITLGLSVGAIGIKEYQKQRLLTFFSSQKDITGSGYNVAQSIVAVGSGGMWGMGLGKGSQSQLNFLPEKRTDFVFALVSEEMGWAGASVLLLLFGVLLYRIKEVSKVSRDNFGFLLSLGIFLLVIIQLGVNIGMNIGLMPVTGVPLPLVSYGGSSLISFFIAMGVVESIYLRRTGALD